MSKIEVIKITTKDKKLLNDSNNNTFMFYILGLITIGTLAANTFSYILPRNFIVQIILFIIFTSLLFVIFMKNHIQGSILEKFINAKTLTVAFLINESYFTSVNISIAITLGLQILVILIYIIGKYYFKYKFSKLYKLINYIAFVNIITLITSFHLSENILNKISYFITGDNLLTPSLSKYRFYIYIFLIMIAMIFLAYKYILNNRKHHLSSILILAYISTVLLQIAKMLYPTVINNKYNYGNFIIVTISYVLALLMFILLIFILHRIVNNEHLFKKEKITKDLKLTHKNIRYIKENLIIPLLCIVVGNINLLNTRYFRNPIYSYKYVFTDTNHLYLINLIILLICCIIIIGILIDAYKFELLSKHFNKNK